VGQQANNLKLNRAKSLEIIFETDAKSTLISVATDSTGNRSHDINQNARRHSDQPLVSNMCVTSSADMRSRYMHLSFFEVMG